MNEVLLYDAKFGCFMSFVVEVVVVVEVIKARRKKRVGTVVVFECVIIEVLYYN